MQLQENLLLQHLASDKPSVSPRSHDFSNSIDSLIIRQGDKDADKHLQLLRESFGQPAQLERIFRASEHGFSAAAFHKHCNDIEDTLTILRTEFGRTIGGYSHYKWNAVSRDYVRDEGRRAFLLSFGQKEKYVPQGGEADILPPQ
jgi:hypothetical protein